jgi:hypothetical protein
MSKFDELYEATAAKIDALKYVDQRKLKELKNDIRAAVDQRKRESGHPAKLTITFIKALAFQKILARTTKVDVDPDGMEYFMSTGVGKRLADHFSWLSGVLRMGRDSDTQFTWKPKTAKQVEKIFDDLIKNSY